MSDIEKKHCKFSPSGASRWLKCPMSVEFEKKETNKTHADEGTLAHNLADHFLNQINLQQYEHLIREEGAGFAKYIYQECKQGLMEKMIKEIGSPMTIGNEEMYEMARSVSVYIKHIVKNTDYLNNYFSDIYYKEHRLSYNDIVFGHVDFACIEYPFKIQVFDFKYGIGKPVSAEKNPQLMLYAAMLVYSMEMEQNKSFVNSITYGEFVRGLIKIKLHVIQPRTNNISVYEITRGELMNWFFGEVIPSIFDATTGKNMKYSSGEHCSFCPTKSNCFHKHSEYSKKLLEMKSRIVEQNNVTSKDMAVFIKDHKEIGSVITQYKNEIKGRIENGEKIEGYDIKPVYGVRSWDKSLTKQECADRIFSVMRDLGMPEDSDLLFENKLKSPTSIEKAIGKKEMHRIDDIITRNISKTKLVMTGTESEEEEEDM